MENIWRLDPARPLLWRDEHTLQVGVDAVVTIPHPEPWQLALLHALEMGLPHGDIEHLATREGCATAEIDAFLNTLAPALRRDPVRVDIAVTIVEHAASHDTARAFADAAEAAGARMVQQAPIVIVLTPHTLLPRTAATWMSTDRIHVPIVISGTGITVGPVIVPGTTACAACLAADHRERDDAWPVLIAQLLARPFDLPARALYAQAASLALQLVAEHDIASAESRSVTVDSTTRQLWTTHQPHADCGCRSLEGSEKASVADALSLGATTMPAFARRA